jgi:nitrogenase molybdenum-iron protein NifN
MKTLKPIEINPLKTSSSLGAAIVFLGVNNAVALMHGSQGCASFDKVLLTKHYRENIPIMTTVLNETGAILGGSEFLKAGVINIAEKIKPAFIGITSTGLTEVNGEDIVSTMKELKNELNAYPDMRVVYVSTPDYTGTLEAGYKNAVLALIKEFAKKKKDFAASNSNKNKKRLRANIFCPFSFTSIDFLELREVLEYFGITPVMIPDLGASMDGHLDVQGYLQTTADGIDIKDIATISSNDLNIVIGLSLLQLVEPLNEITGLKTHYFPNVSGLKNTDNFFNFLSKLTSLDIPEKYKRQRRQLMDAYLDSHFYFSGKNIAMALGADLLDSFSAIYGEIGASLEIGITTMTDDRLKGRFEIYEEGDLDLLDELIETKGDIDLIISNSNAKYYAEKSGIPLFKAGFPIIDEIGYNFKHHILYRGSANLTYETANMLL